MSSWKRFRLRLLRLFRGSDWRGLSMEDVVERFGTPERVSDYMQVCFRYVSDRELFGEDDVWQPPARVFERRVGDCEDYALFAWHVLRVHGIPAHLFSAFTEGRGHAMCVFEEDWKLHTICNAGLRRWHVTRGGSQARPNDRTARKLAECIYPGIWTACGFVKRLEVGLGPGGDVERLLPEYEWVVPLDGG